MMRESLRQDQKRVWVWRALILWWVLLMMIVAARAAVGTGDQPSAIGLVLLALGSIALGVHELDGNAPRRRLWLVLSCAFIVGSMAALWRAVS